jgi:acetyl esterase/lipase
VGGVPGWWCRPQDAPEKAAILYLHGGAYILGSAKAHRNFVGHIALRAGTAAFVPDYRLAPEHPFPAAVEDARAAYRGLVKQGVVDIALAGDSAGGGLALVLLSLMVAEARADSRRHPRGAAVMSPWTDLSLSGASLKTRADADPFLTEEALASAARLYLGQNDPRDLLASPLFGNMAGLPPILLHVGEDEVLLDDARRYADQVSANDGDIQLHIWAGMPHVFPSNIGTLASANGALGVLGAFLREQSHSRDEGG